MLCQKYDNRRYEQEFIIQISRLEVVMLLCGRLKKLKSPNGGCFVWGSALRNVPLQRIAAEAESEA